MVVYLPKIFTGKLISSCLFLLVSLMGFSLRYVGESLYIPEEDLHAPTLTLKQTLTFALRNKTPGTRVRDEHKKRAFRNKMFELLTGMFGIRKQANTV